MRGVCLRRRLKYGIFRERGEEFHGRLHACIQLSQPEGTRPRSIGKVPTPSIYRVRVLFGLWRVYSVQVRGERVCSTGTESSLGRDYPITFAARSPWTQTHRKATTMPLLHPRSRAHHLRCSPDAVWGSYQPRAFKGRSCTSPLSHVCFDSRAEIERGVFVSIRENPKLKYKIQTEV